MADNLKIPNSNSADAKTVALDDVGGVLYQLIKLAFGDDGVATMVDASNPLPVVDTALAGLVDGVETLLTSLGTNTDTLEALAGTLNSTTATAAKQDAAKAVLDTIAGAIVSAAMTIRAPLNAPAAVRLSDGTSGLGITSGRLHVSDGGTALTTAPSTAGDVASTLTDGRKTVATPGTAVPIRTSLACEWVEVTALKSNTQDVYVGGSAVLATAGSEAGQPLAAGETNTFPVDNASKVFVDALVAGEGVTWTVGS